MSQPQIVCCLLKHLNCRTFAGAADSLLASFLDYEKEGVPAGAGKAGQHGFDLVSLAGPEILYCFVA